MATTFENKAAREAAIVKFITELWRQCEDDTKPDRDRWRRNNMFFQGIQDWGPDREDQPWMSKTFLPQFPTIVRRAANLCEETIFSREDFFNLVPGGGDKTTYDELCRIYENMIRHYIKLMRSQRLMYKTFLGGMITGVSILRLELKPVIKKTAAAIVAMTSKQQQKDFKKLQGKVEGIPTDEATSPVAGTPGSEDAMIKSLTEGISALFPELLAGQPKVPEDRLELQITGRVVDPLNFCFYPLVDELSETPYTLERRFIPVFECERMFDSGVFAGSHKKDFLAKKGGERTISKLSLEQMNLEQKRQYSTKQNGYVQEREIVEYFGPFLAEDGSIIEEDCHFIIGSGKYVLRDKKNPYWGLRPHPYLCPIFSLVPNKATGSGVADFSVETNQLTNNLMSLFVDMLTLATYGAYAVNTDALDDESDVENGIQPGKIIKFSGSRPVQDSLAPVQNQVNQIAPVMFNIIEALSLWQEKGSGIDTQSANPASRARISASEISSNVDKSTTSVFALAKDLDESLIEPFVRGILGMVIQFSLQSPVLEQLNVSGVLSESDMQLLKNIPATERFDELNRNIKIKINGFRERLERQEFLAKINELLQTIGMMPPGSTTLDWQELLKKVLHFYNFTEDDIDDIIPLNSPQDKAREENVILGNQQFMSLGPQDNHAAELVIHYDGAMANPNDAYKQHIIAHIQAMQMQGQAPPMPPKELEGFLGFAEQGAAEAGPGMMQ